MMQYEQFLITQDTLLRGSRYTFIQTVERKKLFLNGG